MMALAIPVLGFIATEVLLYTASMAVSSEPFALVVASTLALWFWLGVGLSHKTVETFHARFTDDADFIHVPAAWVMSGLLSLTIAVGIGPWLLYMLWASLNFGEPPFNRSVEIRKIVDRDGYPHTVGEFSVALFPLHGIRFGLHQDPARANEFKVWFDRRGTDVYGANDSDVISETIQVDKPSGWAMPTLLPIGMESVTPDRSLFVDFGQSEIILDDCHFGPANVSLGEVCRIKDGVYLNVTVRMVSHAGPSWR